MTVHNKVYTSIIFQVWFCVVIVRENKPKFNANKEAKCKSYFPESRSHKEV